MNELIINGVLYRAVEEEKPKRSIYWIAKMEPYDGTVFSADPRTFQSGVDPCHVKKVTELNAGEIIISKKDLLTAWNKHTDEDSKDFFEDIAKELGF